MSVTRNMLLYTMSKFLFYHW